MLFESFSGLTTTGATTLVAFSDSLPHAILLSSDAANGLAHGDHCAGGAISLSSASGMQLYRAEMPVRPKITKCARVLPRRRENAVAYLCFNGSLRAGAARGDARV